VALFILKSDRELAENLARALIDVKEKIRLCSICYNLTDDDPCAICRDENRSNGVVCVVEGPGDQLAVEESGVYQGRYHILHGVLSPLDGVGPEDLRVTELLSRIEEEGFEEVILATNPTAEGEATASYLAKFLAPKGLKITRIALGVPMGGDLKYMDAMTLQHALKSRISLTS
jgi:recombination protein RecR